MTKFVAGVLAVLVLSGLSVAQCATRTNDYVNASGYKVNTAKPCTMWFISDALDIPRNGLQGLILIAEQSDMVIVGTVVRPKATLDTSAATLLKLMRLSNELDYVKIGIDNDGDLFVRAELRVRMLDAAEFKTAVQNVISAGAKAYAATK
jgi:hypothetical protein